MKKVCHILLSLSLLLVLFPVGLMQIHAAEEGTVEQSYVIAIEAADHLFTEGYIYNTKYTTRETQYDGYSLENEQYVRNLAKEIVGNAKTQKEKVHLILDWVYKNFTYADGGGVAHFDTAYQAIMNKRGVCEDYVLIVNELCFYSGMRALQVGIDRISHALCLVQVDGTWMYIDPTAHSDLMSAKSAYLSMKALDNNHGTARAATINLGSFLQIYVDPYNQYHTDFHLPAWGYYKGSLKYFDGTGKMYDEDPSGASIRNGWKSVDYDSGAKYFQNGNYMIGRAVIDGKLYDFGLNGQIDYAKTLEKNVTLYPKEKKQLEVVFEADNANEKKELTWTSSNPKVASVDQNGVVTAGVEGGYDATITVRSKKGFQSTTNISVPVPIIYRIDLSTNSKTVNKNDRFQLKANVISPENHKFPVTWKSNNTKVATVDQSGNVVAKGVGMTYITADVYGKATVKCLVVVTEKGQVAISPSKAITTVGNNFNAKAYYAQDQMSFTWKSSSPSIAKVTSDGQVIPLKKGYTYIIATASNGKSNKFLLEVSDLSDPTSVVVNPATLTISKGKEYSLNTTVLPTNATDKSVTYQSSSPSIASVNTNGTIKALKSGYTYIIVRTSNGKQAKCLVKVIDIFPTKVSMNLSNATLSIGKAFNAKATVYPTNATNKNVTWSSGNTKVVKVDAYGKVTTVGAGTTYVYAKTSNGIAGKILVKVLPNPTGVAITPKSATVRIGATFKARGIVTPSNAATAFTFKSSSPSIATVDANGNVKAIKEGYTYITVTTHNRKSSSFLLRVVK